MLPDLTPKGVLPPGVHVVEWHEIWDAFGTTLHRRRLLIGFRRALEALRRAGCRRAYLDGSLVTAKEAPGDFDGCWETGEVDPEVLDPILLNFDSGRLAQKVKYGGELFPSDWITDANSGNTFLEFFQIDKETGDAKGIIAIDLERIPS